MVSVDFNFYGVVMRRADRLLQIVQVLRRRGAMTTAKVLAEELEVVPRTIYRDVAALQSAGVPIDGEAGVGYLLRPGYDLPPMMFSSEEMEAIVLGARMVIDRGDKALSRAAENVLAKIQAVVPKKAADQMWRASLLVPHPLEDGVSFGPHVPIIRQAIRNSQKIQISYIDLKGRESTRTVWPLGLYLYSHVTLLCTWCEERLSFRAFRSERISKCNMLDTNFDAQNGVLMKSFLAAFIKA
jgi:predicted DNA-binding transcriptional regulator YafY